MSERKTKRKVKKFWEDLATQGWGEWEEIPPETWGRSPIPPIAGLKKFVKNNIYSVQITDVGCGDWGEVTRLIIRRHDQGTNVSWKDKQRIKSEIVGAEGTALEVFPPESKLFDYANLYHLWIIPDHVNLPIVLGGSRGITVRNI
jgi:hypothetical protein